MPARPDPAIIEAKKAEIARRYRRRRKHATKPQFASIRLAELGRLYRARYGDTLPDTPAGREALEVAAHHLIQLAGHPMRRIHAWALERCPWLTLPELDRLVSEVATRPKTWTADKLAWRLRLTYADRQTLKITTIGAIDCSKTKRQNLRRIAQRKRMKKLRANKRLAACAP